MEELFCPLKPGENICKKGKCAWYRFGDTPENGGCAVLWIAHYLNGVADELWEHRLIEERREAEG